MAPTVNTVIFVDIDGVLNVGIKDGDEAPLLLNSANVAYAEYATKNSTKLGPDEARAVQKLVAVARHKDEEGCLFADRSCKGDRHVSDVLIRRLADIIAAAKQAGPTKVILASNWRRPKYANRVRSLEKDLSDALCEDFVFDGRTRPADERLAKDRLRCIGDYLEHHSTCSEGSTRVLVLDDLFVTPLDGWVCGNATCGMQCVYKASDIEAYLRSRIEKSGVSVKMIYPYAEWTAADGSTVQVGCGLSQSDVQAATEFLSVELPMCKMSSMCSTEPAEDSSQDGSFSEKSFDQLDTLLTGPEKLADEAVSGVACTAH